MSQTTEVSEDVFAGIVMPTMSHQFQLGEWGSPSKHLAPLRNQLISVELNYKTNDFGRLIKQITFTFEDDRLGLVANAIDAFYASPQLVTVNIMEGSGGIVNQFVFDDLEIKSLNYKLYYGANETAKWIVVGEAKNIKRVLPDTK